MHDDPLPNRIAFAGKACKNDLVIMVSVVWLCSGNSKGEGLWDSEVPFLWDEGVEGVAIGKGSVVQ